MTNIYIVKGDAGMYSDWEIWDICACVTEAAAQKQVKELTAKKNEVIKTLSLRDADCVDDLPKKDIDRLEKLGAIYISKGGYPYATNCNCESWLCEIEDVNYTYNEVELKDE